MRCGAVPSGARMRTASGRGCTHRLHTRGYPPAPSGSPIRPIGTHHLEACARTLDRGAPTGDRAVRGDFGGLPRAGSIASPDTCRCQLRHGDSLERVRRGASRPRHTLVRLRKRRRPHHVRPESLTRQPDAMAQTIPCGVMTTFAVVGTAAGSASSSGALSDDPLQIVQQLIR